mmetsp:Transcript_11236/g.37122  ORF Transcript_11236/g.37122 Transcript_11236/m.37122 type:complete len:204 (+) Transcript_11236:1930-2541(+)
MNNPSSAPKASSSKPLTRPRAKSSASASVPNTPVSVVPFAVSSSEPPAGNSAREDGRLEMSSPDTRGSTRLGDGAGDPNAVSETTPRAGSSPPCFPSSFRCLLPRFGTGAGDMDTNACPAISRASYSGECTSFFFTCDGCDRGVRLPTTRGAPPLVATWCACFKCARPGESLVVSPGPKGGVSSRVSPFRVSPYSSESSLPLS